MKILYAASEAAPFVKTGGLGDVAGSLPITLKQKGEDVRVILPLYRCIDSKYRQMMSYITNIYIDIGWRRQYCGVFSMEYKGTTYYFVDNEYYFGGDKPYDFIHLDCEKFIFFSKAVLSLLPTLDFRPDVINCNDWQTAPIPVFLDTFYDNPFYRGIKTVMTIHNLKFQGRWDLEKIKDAMAIGDYYFTSDKLEYYKDANLLKGGLVYANKITTVSETYAKEIMSPEYGEGLDGLLRAREGDTVGIVNGISDDWNPETDDLIFKKYSLKTAEDKKANKVALQKELNLEVNPDKFMVGMVSRLTDQKGFDLISCVMERLLEGGYQIVVLGTGDENYENMFRYFAGKFPDRMSANIYFSNELSHKIYAACDAFLMPSRFEPCGLSQIIAMRYGTLPIVRETGGLKDTVKAYNEFTGEGTGFSFGDYNAEDMYHVINYAMRTYYDNPKAWEKLIGNAMKQDFSWSVSAEKYLDLYRSITGIKKEPEKTEKPKKAPKKATKKAPKKRTSTFEKTITADVEASETVWTKETSSKDKEIIKNLTDKEKAERLNQLKKEIEKTAPKASEGKKKADKKAGKEQRSNGKK